MTMKRLHSVFESFLERMAMKNHTEYAHNGYEIMRSPLKRTIMGREVVVAVTV
jgi:thiamine phosphate synthase YjbQ (UPF0047 family)